ncbi:Embryo-specific protein ATS3A [Hirschfeldia incana]|nr:Embryo-specific protein ATS3A [Hirschfeldia incana]
MLRVAISLILLALCSVTSARSFVTTRPGPIDSFLPTPKLEGAKVCSYTVIIKTSCSSVSYTRDKISIAFGDVYGNEVYVKRLDNPKSKAFEKCSSDTYKINGPCMRDVCYLHLLRQGSDGWKPENVKVYGSSIRSVTFYYNLFLPNGVWYGFDVCNGIANANANAKSSQPITASVAAM